MLLPKRTAAVAAILTALSLFACSRPATKSDIADRRSEIAAARQEARSASAPARWQVIPVNMSGTGAILLDTATGTTFRAITKPSGDLQWVEITQTSELKETLRELARRVAPKVGEIIVVDGQKHRVIGFDEKTGKPLVDPAVIP